MEYNYFTLFFVFYNLPAAFGNTSSNNNRCLKKLFISRSHFEEIVHIKFAVWRNCPNEPYWHSGGGYMSTSPGPSSSLSRSSSHFQAKDKTPDRWGISISLSVWTCSLSLWIRLCPCVILRIFQFEEIVQIKFKFEEIVQIVDMEMVGHADCVDGGGGISIPFSLFESEYVPFHSESVSVHV